MQFSDVVAGMAREGDIWRAHIGEEWLQGRSAFGGLQAALAIRAMQAEVPDVLDLRTLQTTFIAPVPSGPVQVRARRLRTGGSTVQMEARLLDGDQTLALMLGVFGKPRTSQLRVLPAAPQPLGAGGHVLAYQPGLFPSFTQHFAARWVRGALPFSGGTDTRHSLELALRDVGPFDAGHVAALADFIPPIALTLLHRPTPGSSLTWMLELLGAARDRPLAGWHVEAQLEAALDGYTSQSVQLWAPDGSPMALSRQCMVVFG